MIRGLMHFSIGAQCTTVLCTYNCNYNCGINVMLAIKTNQKCQTLSLIFHGPSVDPVTVTEHSDLDSTIQQQLRADQSRAVRETVS